MLYLTLLLNNELKTIESHFGEPIKMDKNHIKNVVSIQADCDELEYIKNNMNGLVYPKNKRVITFYGDSAKMIAQLFTYRN